MLATTGCRTVCPALNSTMRIETRTAVGQTQTAKESDGDDDG
jgi:hypothetical protein